MIFDLLIRNRMRRQAAEEYLWTKPMEEAVFTVTDGLGTEQLYRVWSKEHSREQSYPAEIFGKEVMAITLNFSYAGRYSDETFDKILDGKLSYMDEYQDTGETPFVGEDKGRQGMKVIRTIMQIFKEIIESKDPDVIEFAPGDDRLAKLYEVIIKRIERAGYENFAKRKGNAELVKNDIAEKIHDLNRCVDCNTFILKEESYTMGDLDPELLGREYRWVKKWIETNATLCKSCYNNNLRRYQSKVDYNRRFNEYKKQVDGLVRDVAHDTIKEIENRSNDVWEYLIADIGMYHGVEHACSTMWTNHLNGLVGRWLDEIANDFEPVQVIVCPQESR